MKPCENLHHIILSSCENRYKAVQQKRVKLSIIELRATFQPLAGAEAVQQKRVKLSRRSAAELQLPAVVATMRPLVTCQIHGKNWRKEYIAQHWQKFKEITKIGDNFVENSQQTKLRFHWSSSIMSHCIGVMYKMTAVKEMWSTNDILEMSLADSICEVEWYKSCRIYPYKEPSGDLQLHPLHQGRECCVGPSLQNRPCRIGSLLDEK